jgi:ATP-dependent DNA ligase
LYHHERQLIQFAPARAKQKYLVPLPADAANKLLEQKIDGERFVLHTHVGGSYLHACTSRRVSDVTDRYVEKTDRVPHLTNYANLSQKSMIDNEFVSSADAIYRELPGWLWDKLTEPRHPHMEWLKTEFGGAIPIYPHVSHTTSVMGSLGPRAVQLQQERGKIWAYAFDVVQYLGQDARQSPQSNRRQLLASIYEKVDPSSGLVLMPQWRGMSVEQIEYFYYLLTDPQSDGRDGGEGLILKETSARYDAPKNWWKLKRDWPVDVVVTGGYKLGEEGKTGKMLGMVSSIEIGVYHQGHLYPLAFVSAIMDDESGLMTPEEFLESGLVFRVMEARCNGKQDDPDARLGYTLRHPRFRRWRDDKSATDCTLEALLAELGRPRG